ncbi:MAG: ankyrin repeat domain-containing protein [Bryobacteraceae bacterium]|nr:ankyrin repeat domain-containing protein [Bryobacteraceae bacterium]
MRCTLLSYWMLFAGLLLAQGPDFTPPTPLLGALMRNDTAAARRLLANGANPNEGRLIGMTPVFFAAVNQNLALVRELIEKGADLHATDGAGSTPLMWAAANEAGSAAIVDALLQAGADARVKNQQGDTALTWALRRGHTPAVMSLYKADPQATQVAVERSLALLQKSGDQFARVSGCTSCHHQSVTQLVNGLARERGFALNEKIAKQQAEAVVATYRPLRELMLQGTDRIPDTPISVSYALVGLGAERYPADETTHAMAHVISTKQRPDGSFPSLPARPPIESSDITATALSLRALQLYGQEPAAAVTRARDWLLQTKPCSNEDRVMQLLGLAWAQADVEPFAQALLSAQQPDGGWAQLATLETDAYATGQALYALQVAGKLSRTDPAYLRGMGYLLRTQLSDGSWRVRSRAFPFQPYKESGFPHGKDQWISAAGTAWAALALTMGQSTHTP